MQTSELHSEASRSSRAALLPAAAPAREAPRAAAAASLPHTSSSLQPTASGTLSLAWAQGPSRRMLCSESVRRSNGKLIAAASQARKPARPSLTRSWLAWDVSVAGVRGSTPAAGSSARGRRLLLRRACRQASGGGARQAARRSPPAAHLALHRSRRCRKLRRRDPAPGRLEPRGAAQAAPARSPPPAPGGRPSPPRAAPAGRGWRRAAAARRTLGASERSRRRSGRGPRSAAAAA
jgi:hypothetical protein